jgi:hypothetical protein
MVLSPKLAVNRKAALLLLLISLMALCLLKIQPSKADSKVITFNMPCVINENRDVYPLTALADVELPEQASPSPSPSPTPTPTPIDTKPLPTTLLAAVAIVACVFGFGLIINIVTGKRKKQ